MHNTLNIVVADNHTEYRAALSAFLNGTGFAVAWTAPANAALLQRIHAGNLPDLVIIGCSTLYPDSIGLVAELRNRFPSLKILVNVTFLHYLPDARRLYKIIDGVMVKTTAEPAIIIKAIHSACGR